MSEFFPDADTSVALDMEMSLDPSDLRSEIIYRMIGHGALQEFGRIEALLNWASELEKYILNGKQDDANVN